MDLADIYRLFHPTSAKCTFSSRAHRTFSSIDHILHHKGSLNKFKMIEITWNIVSEHNGMKLETHNSKKSRKFTNAWKITHFEKLVGQWRNQKGIYNLPTWTHEEAGNLNRAAMSKEVKVVIKDLPPKGKSGWNHFTDEFFNTFKEELRPMLLKFLQKIEEEGTLPNSFIRPEIPWYQHQIRIL